MTSTAARDGRRPSGRPVLLLVFALLVGVLAMHGLGPGGALGHAGGSGHSGAPHSSPPIPAAASAAVSASAAVPASAAVSVAPHQVHCVRATDGDSGSGHLRHADITCAATGVATSYATPALTAAPDATVTPPAPPGRVAAVTDGGRAPPDLAELQLLRI
ncbi:DUF6153 family protein [Streptomyces sp. NPDC088789]|uniref:DUF6153 family protein n=1 Tax=Streptomyces sp. NPDC088789 TaxID=3365899 RepID=UPI00381E4F24